MKQNETMQEAGTMPADMSDSRLYERAREYGAKAKHWTRKFEGLLPEITRRKLYKKHGFAGIYEFAKKLAGMSERKVDKILWLHGRLSDKPELRKQLETGEQPWHKIEKVAGVATAETDEMWARKVEIETNAVLQLSVQSAREQINRVKSTHVSTSGNESAISQVPCGTIGKIVGERIVEGSGATTGSTTGSTAGEIVENNGKMAGEQMAEDMAAPKWHWLSTPVSPDIELKLRKLKHQLEKERGETITFNEVFKALLEGTAIIEEKPHVIAICPECVRKRAEEKARKKEITRYVPLEIRRIVLSRQRYRCARPACTRPPIELHHLDGFALNKNHNPNRLEYLCGLHHGQRHAHDKYVRAAVMRSRA